MKKVISVLAWKGGCCKTTVATNIAWYYHLAGKKVLLVDIDRPDQITSSNWASLNDESCLITCVSLNSENPKSKIIERDINDLSKGYDIVVIDGRPGSSPIATACIKLADLVVLPVVPSPADTWVFPKMAELIQSRQDMTDGLPKAGILFGMTRHNSKIQDFAMSEIEEFEIPFFKTNLDIRDEYRYSIGLGDGVCSPGKNPGAKKEFKNIMKEIEALLND
jgi:chromosome partitioning protein